MKIAYAGLHQQAQYILGGVGNKILTQVRLWQEAGHQARLFLHSPDTFTLPNTSVFSFARKRGFPSQEVSRSRMLAEMISAIKSWQPDVIYLRYSRYAWPLQQLFNVAPVVMELNTVDLQEYKLRGKLIAAINRLTRGIMLSRAAGLVAVSREIADRPENTRWKTPITVIANGVNLDDFSPLPAQPQTRPAVAMVSSPNLPWHGVEKLSSLALRYPDLDVHIIGYAEKDWSDNHLPQNIHLHGWMQRPDIELILKISDAACGTLALHIKGMDEASPLKVREALAYGLPVILAYKDTDLKSLQSDYILQIPNTPDNIESHATQIYEFIRRMQGRRIPRSEIVQLIDQRQKEVQRLDFLRYCSKST